MNRKSTEHESVLHQLNESSQVGDCLFIRLKMMNIIAEFINQQDLIQKQAAEILKISQPRVSDLMRGKYQLFSVDTLIGMLNKISYKVDFNVSLSDDSDLPIMQASRKQSVTFESESVSSSL